MDILLKSLFWIVFLTIVTTFYGQKYWMKLLKMKEPKDNVKFNLFARRLIVGETLVLFAMFIFYMFFY